MSEKILVGQFNGDEYDFAEEVDVEDIAYVVDFGVVDDEIE